MEKQACHVEWGRLKITGRPTMTGAVIGSSQLMRVACRTSPCLVHVFEDSNLVSVWRFPADPIFLLFGPSFHHMNVKNIEEGKNSDCSLLVITSDSRVWLLDCRKEYDPSTQRLTKKKRDAVPEELQKALEEILVDESDFNPLSWGKSPQSKQCDNLEYVDIRGSQMPGQLGGGKGLIRKAEHNLKDFEDRHVDTTAHHTSISSGLVDLNSKWKKISNDRFPVVDNKLKAELISQEALLTYLPGTLVAAFGPNDSVALLGMSGALKVLPLSSSDLPDSTSTTSGAIHDRSTDMRESGCLLYASVRTQYNTDQQPEGFIALLEAKFFQNLFGDAGNMASPSGILHGDTQGHLYTSLVAPELALSHTRLLCDFGQPIVALLTVPATTPSTSGKNDSLRCEEESKHDGSSLLVIGQLGKVILITGMKEKVVQADDGPFWPTSRSFSWRCRNNTLTARQLSEQNLDFCEWEVFSPITSACMLGPQRLCYCTRSEVFYTDLFENVDLAQMYPHHSKAMYPSIAEPKDSVFVSLLKLSQKLQPSVSHKLTGTRMFKNKLLSQKVPLVDVVVAIAGRGICGGVGSSRPLVALTTRGRLLGVEVSNHVSSRAVSIVGSITKSWRSLESRIEETIQGLLQVVGELAQATNVIKSHSATVTLALKELATALPLAKEICSYEMRTCQPDPSLAGVPPRGKLSAFLTITDHTSALVNPENLSFGPSSAKFVPLTSLHSRKVNIAIRLCNQTGLVISPYWSLLLELRSLSSDQSLHFSLPINGRMGLLVGTEYTHEFMAQLPGKGLDPVFAYLFLCHHHHYHHLIAKPEPPLVSSCKAFPHATTNESCARLIDSSSSKLRSVLNVLGTEQAKLLESSQTSGAVCIVLSQYRIDLLSLLQVVPPQLGIDTCGHFRSAGKHPNMNASSLYHDNFLRRFSSKCILTCLKYTPDTLLKDTAKLWQDLYLDDLLRKGSVSQAGQKVSVSAYDSETFCISLKLGTAGEKCTLVEVLLESSSLLLGSYLREALMWRLDSCKDWLILKEYRPWQLARSVKTKHLSFSLSSKSDCYDKTIVNGSAERSQEGFADAVKQAKPINVTDMVTELDERLAVILELWGNVLRTPEKVQFTSLLNETYTAIQDVMLAYRTCRADEPETTTIS